MILIRNSKTKKAYSSEIYCKIKYVQYSDLVRARHTGIVYIILCGPTTNELYLGYTRSWTNCIDLCRAYANAYDALRVANKLNTNNKLYIRELFMEDGIVISASIIAY